MRLTLIGWVLSLLVAAGLASALTAQVAKKGTQIVSGNDVGFRIEGTGTSGEPLGTLVIRVDGRWVVPGSPVVTKRLK